MTEPTGVSSFLASKRDRGRLHSRIDDEVSRSRKASKILAVLHNALGPDLSGYTCLDVGCSSGLITKHLAPRLHYTVGLEYDGCAIRRGAKVCSSQLGLVQADGQRLPIRDAAVHLVICAQVYEHVADASLLFAEIWRVLAPGGLCFLSGPNRLYPMELHYRLPLVHWLPHSWARACVRMLGRDTGQIVRTRTLWGLRRGLEQFEIEDYTLAMLARPDEFSCTEEMGRLSWMSRLPHWLLRAALPLTPNFNWVLRKPVN